MVQCEAADGCVAELRLSRTTGEGGAAEPPASPCPLPLVPLDSDNLNSFFSAPATVFLGL
jgi:hypothetical protein